MKSYCENCGEKTSPKASFCSECGHDVRIDMRTNISEDAAQPIWRVGAMQILLFFIFPIWFYRKQLRENDLKAGKILDFSFYAQNSSLLFMLLGALIGGVWIIQTIPKEGQLTFLVAQIMLGAGYLGLLILVPMVWFVMAIVFVRRFNSAFTRRLRMNYILALIAGPLYIQFRINQIPYRGTAKSKNERNIDRLFKRAYKVMTVCLMFLLIFTHMGSRTYAIATLGNIGELTNSSGMDFMGKYILKTSNPKLTTMDEVSTVCNSQSEKVFTYGCNVTDDSGSKIYVSTISISELKGIEASAVAHEMLHTVYARMSDVERNSINKAIDEAYSAAQNSSDEHFKQAIEPYKNDEAVSFHNELHSILVIYKGDLGPILEKHYSKYFKDRQKLVDAYAKSDQFIIDFQTNLGNWEKGLAKWEDSLNDFVSTLNQQGSLLDAYDYRGNIYAYNNLVPVYNKNLDAYKKNYDDYTNYYNQYKTVYNSYTSMMTALRRNITYSEASKLVEANVTTYSN